MLGVPPWLELKVQVPEELLAACDVAGLKALFFTAFPEHVRANADADYGLWDGVTLELVTGDKLPGFAKVGNAAFVFGVKGNEHAACQLCLQELQQFQLYVLPACRVPYLLHVLLFWPQLTTKT